MCSLVIRAARSSFAPHFQLPWTKTPLRALSTWQKPFPVTPRFPKPMQGRDLQIVSSRKGSSFKQSPYLFSTPLLPFLIPFLHLFQQEDSSKISWADLEKIAATFEIALPEERDESAFSTARMACFEAAFAACKEGEWGKVDRASSLLHHLINQYGQTLLIVAVERFAEDAVKGLLQRKIGITQTDAAGNTPIHYAACNNSTTLIPLLLEFFSINAPNNQKKPPLLSAIHSEFPVANSIAYLVKTGASLKVHTVVDSFKLSPLALAVYLGKEEDVDALIASGKVDLDEEIEGIGTLLHVTIQSGQARMLEHLLTKYEKARSLMERKDDKGRTPLSLAAYRGEARIIDFLVGKMGERWGKEHTADIETQDKNDYRPIHWAVLGKSREAVTALALLGCNLDPSAGAKRIHPFDLLEKLEGPGKEDFAAFFQNVLDHPPIQGSQDHPPENLVFQGGGAKGIAYVGALEALEKRHALSHVKRVAGTSAGAITASLFACGCPIPQLRKTLEQMDVDRFFDYHDPAITQETLKKEFEGGKALVKEIQQAVATDSKWRILYTALTSWAPKVFHLKDPAIQTFSLLDKHRGLCSGEELRKWIEKQIFQLTGKQYCTFGELSDLIKSGKHPELKHLHVVGTKLGCDREIVHFSTEDSKCSDIIISDAVRISGSYPFVFDPHYIHIKNEKGERISCPERGLFIDGGLVENLSMKTFDKIKCKKGSIPKGEGEHVWHNPYTWGLSLYNAAEPKAPLKGGIKEFTEEFVSVFLQAESIIRNSTQKDDRRIIFIDDLGVKATEPLPKEKMPELILSGTRAVDQHLKDWHWGALGNTSLFYDPLLRQRKETEGLLHLDPVHRDFIGREGIIQQMGEQLAQRNWRKQDPVWQRVFHGLGGTGKSELLFACLNCYLDQFSLVWQINCETEASRDRDYKLLAEALKIPTKDYQNKDLPPKVIRDAVHGRLENGEFSKPWALVLDNVVQRPKADDLPKRGGYLFISTQNKGDWPAADVVSVPPFTMEEGIALLKAITNEAESPAMRMLIQDLDGVPLLLNYAGHYIKATPGCSIESYQKDMSQLMTKEVGPLWRKMDPSKRYDKSLAISWGLTLDSLSQLNEPKEIGIKAIKWLNLCAYLNPENIPLKWLDIWLKTEGIEDPENRVLKEDLRRILSEDFGLLKDTGSTFSIHRFLQAIQKQRSQSPEEDLSRVLDLLENSRASLMTAKDREIWWLHVQAFENRRKTIVLPHNLKTAFSLMRLGNELSTLGKRTEALQYHKEVLERRKDLLGNEHADVAMSLENIGVELFNLGKYPTALNYQEEALKMRKKLLGNEHPDVGLSLNNIGGVLFAMGKYPEAVVHQIEALQIFKKSLGYKHPYVANSLHNVGTNLFILGYHDVALAHIKEALELSKTLLGEEHQDVAMILNSWGEMLSALRDHHEALKHKREALKIFRKLLGNKHPHVAMSLNNIGGDLSALGDHNGSLECLKEALEILRKLDNHPYLVINLSNIGENLSTLGDHQEALKYNKEALELSYIFFREQPIYIGAYLKAVVKNLNSIQDKELIEKTKTELYPLCAQILGKEHEAVQALLKAGT